MTAVYQGEPGAYSEAAAAVLAPEARTRGLATFHDVFDAVASGAAERGVVPIENTIGASVTEVVDEVFANGGVRIVGEYWMPIAHALLAPKGTILDEIREIRSHPQAIAQCAASLGRLVPDAQLVVAADTAGAARALANDPEPGVAAIASLQAAERYGLAVLAEHVESDAANLTRFLLLAPSDVTAELGAPMKSTLILAPRDAVPNALFRSMTAFVGRRLRVHRLEPRPQVGRPGHYRYLADVDGDAQDDTLASALVDVRALCDEVRVVGSYAAGSLPA